jgi:hypothetical protein
MARSFTLRFEGSRALALALAAASLAATAMAAGCGSSDDGFAPGTGSSKGGGGGAAGADGGNKGGAAGTLNNEGGLPEGAAGSTAGSGGGATSCTGDTQCAATPETPYCGASGLCVGCEASDPAHVCPAGKMCCGATCQDFNSDPNNCGGCGQSCKLPEANSGCVNGGCMIISCKSGYADCDGLVQDGCESMLAADGGGCSCPPGMVESCYDGTPGTDGVGPCKAGTHACDANGIAWSACEGQVVPQVDGCYDDIDNDCNGVVNDGVNNGVPGCACLPGSTVPCYEGLPGTEGVGICHGGTMSCISTGVGYDICTGQETGVKEICGNGVDDNCNGQVDENPDLDGDGYGVCGGDCCDKAGPVCGSPALVNPGAIEVAGDGVDNNCDGQVDENPNATCSSGTNFDADVSVAKALALLHAMDICQDSVNGSWGIVPGSYSLTRADGSGSVTYTQVGIDTQFGNGTNVPKLGPNFAVLSAGHARDGSDPDPTATISYTYVTGSPPADFVAPHGGVLPSTGAGCPNGSGANDSVRLRVQLKAPSNANSFSFQFRFYSQEYTTWTCTSYNDFFITMLDTTWTPGPGQTAIPADKNICFDSNGSYISVNSNQFFTTCTPKSGYPCPDGTAGLAGTGYQGEGGATKWLQTTAPVKPGETITLRFVIWDTSDQAWDSSVLIDNFRWSAEPSTGPITE